MAFPHNILLTIDVEDWFQVENLRPWFPPTQWHLQDKRVEQNTTRLLDLFDTAGKDDAQGCVGPVRATFFVLGWVAERYPDLIREINRRGHEVASHGFGHMMCDTLGRDELESDVLRSKHLLEEITGKAVYGYRAPNFSVSDHVLEVVRAAGYRYDSSYNDFNKHARYGRISSNGMKKKGIALTISDDFCELPISNVRIGRQILPWGGGGYFRFLPFSIFKRGIHRILKHNHAYMFYIHPWEIDPDQPRVHGATGLSGWRHYLNLHKTHARLARLIHQFRGCKFITCSDYIDSHC